MIKKKWCAEGGLFRNGENQGDDITTDLSSELTKALDDTMAQFAPQVRYNSGELFGLSSAVYRHCNTWERVPDASVDVE